MSELTCTDCERTFSSRSSYMYHITNKVCYKDHGHECKYCHKIFSHRNSMYRHMRISCKERNDFSDDSEESEDTSISPADKMMEEMRSKLQEFDAMKERIANLEKENKELKGPENTVVADSVAVNNGIIHNGEGDINLIVNVVPFGKEDLSRINKTEMLKVFAGGFNSTLRLTETTHFNPRYPEFHNVYISSMKNKYAMTYDGNDWQLVMKDELIDTLYDRKRDYIEENLDEFLDSLTNSQTKALQRWMDGGDDHPYVRKIKNDMKLMLYNKRKMAIENKYRSVSIIDTDDYKSTSYRQIIQSRDPRVIKTQKYIENIEELSKKRRVAPRNGRYRKNLRK